MPVPTSCCRGWWVAGRPANKHTNSSACHCSSIVSFYDHWKDSLAGRVCNFKPFQEIWNLNSKCKESAIYFQRYFCLLPVLYMEFSAPRPTVPQGLAENICFLSLVKKHIYFFLHPCLLNLDKYPCLFKQSRKTLTFPQKSPCLPCSNCVICWFTEGYWIVLYIEWPGVWVGL